MRESKSDLDSNSALGLGIDAGGTRTRWALATRAGEIVGEGQGEGLSALQMTGAAGRQAVQAGFASLCQAVLSIGQPGRVCAGLSGFGGDGEQLVAWLAGMLSIRAQDVALCSDIEIAFLDSFEPGQGYLVYAGTGSIAAFIDRDGQFHRAGGRGVLLDDGGGGYWIAREALRHIWRGEDECPGNWRGSAMAQAVFEQVGGSDWACSRQFMYGQERGRIGELALAVAATCDTDPAACHILQQAGRELARLALALTARHGPRPIVLSGRAAGLHPAIAVAMRAALPATFPLRQADTQPHFAAARIAAGAGARAAPSPAPSSAPAPASASASASAPSASASSSSASTSAIQPRPAPDL